MSDADDSLNVADTPARLVDLASGNVNIVDATRLYFLGERRVIATALREAVNDGEVIPESRTFIADLDIGSLNSLIERYRVHADVGALASDPIGGVAVVGATKQGIIAAKPITIRIVDRDGRETTKAGTIEIGTGFPLAILRGE